MLIYENKIILSGFMCDHVQIHRFYHLSKVCTKEHLDETFYF